MSGESRAWLNAVRTAEAKYTDGDWGDLSLREWWA